MKDYYRILRINQGVTAVEIKKAYRKLALEFHPDKNKAPNAHEQFIEIQTAYEILIDPVKRAEYDNFLKRKEEYNKKTEYSKNQKQETYSTDFNKNYKSQNAEKYANMTYKEFENFVDQIVSFGKATKKTTEKGCAWIAAIILFPFGLIGLLSTIFGDGVLWWFWLIMMFFGYGAYAMATEK